MPRTAKVVAFSTTPDMADHIDRVARERGMTRSELLRDAFRAYAGTADVAREPLAAYGTTTRSAPAPAFEAVRVARGDIAAICARRGVARLWLFGSAVRGDFVAGSSDYDFVVEWRPDATRGPWLSHVLDFERELSGLLGAHVDVVEAGTVRNPSIAGEIERERVLVYDAS